MIVHHSVSVIPIYKSFKTEDIYYKDGAWKKFQGYSISPLCGRHD